MDTTPTFKSRWDNLIATAAALQTDAETTLMTARDELTAADSEKAVLVTERDTTWPREAIHYLPAFWALGFPTWRGYPRTWLAAHRSKTGAALKAVLGDLRWQLASRNRVWNERHEEQHKQLKRGLNEARVARKSLDQRLRAFTEPLGLARRHAKWLLELPVAEIVRPKGIARYLPLGRSKTHYQRAQLKSIRQARKQYAKALTAANYVLAWVPTVYHKTVSLESLKLDFYSALLRPNPVELSAILQQAEFVSAAVQLDAKTEADLTAMRRITHEQASR
jgi:hypothetical protein